MMPFIDGRYRTPPYQLRLFPSPIMCAQQRLEVYLWNVLAFEYDGEEQNAAVWRHKAAQAATRLRNIFDSRWGEMEAEQAVVGCWMAAQEMFQRDLAREGTPKSSFADVPDSRSTETECEYYRFREGRGIEPVFM